jgi:Uma2 family endonuclease
MSAQTHPSVTEDEYLKLERAAEFRSEFHDGHIYAMSGGSIPHGQIIGNLSRELGVALLNKPCSVMPNDVRVRIQPGRFYTYPDIIVVCGPIAVADDQNDTLLNPTLLIEVLSDSTEAYDRGRKFAHYRQLESLQEYALVSQNRASVEIFRRQPSGDWLLSASTGLDAICRFESVGCQIPLAEVYHRVTLGGEPAPPA